MSDGLLLFCFVPCVWTERRVCGYVNRARDKLRRNLHMLLVTILSYQSDEMLQKALEE